MTFLSQLDPKKVEEALEDKSWMFTMHEELDQFKINKVWDLVPKPSDHPTIDKKWVYQSKADKVGVVVKNKDRLVAQGYS